MEVVDTMRTSRGRTHRLRGFSALVLGLRKEKSSSSSKKTNSA
jgi:hypothetical protein